MTNPLRGIYLNNRWYNYEADSYQENLTLRNSVREVYSGRAVNILGTGGDSYTLTLALDSTYTIRQGELSLGVTTWLGVSRKIDLENFIGAKGTSMPLIFVTPYGHTVNVIPVGQLSKTIFNSSNPGATTGVEFRISLTLQQL